TYRRGYRSPFTPCIRKARPRLPRCGSPTLKVAAWRPASLIHPVHVGGTVAAHCRPRRAHSPGARRPDGAGSGRGRRQPRLVLVEVALDLPVANLGAVVVPFGALGLEVVAEHVVAQRVADDGVSLQLV